VTPVVTVTPVKGTVGINPAKGATVTVQHGTLASVTLVDAAGTSVKGALSADRTSWKATDRLAFDTAYTLTYTLTGGQPVVSTFTTTPAALEADAAVYPGKGAVVGVGMPLQITFSEPVINKKAVEKAITITTSAGQTGRFRWLSDTVVRYRPEKFWAANSTITVDMKLFGVELGGEMIGNFDATHTFSVHNVRHAIISNHDLTLRCYIDGKLVNSFPSTLGTDRWPSADGIFPIIEQARRTWFRAESIGLKPGDQDYYEPFQYEWTSRLTWSGVYVHKVLDPALPYLGREHISHGCVGLSYEGATFIYNEFKPGDIIEVRDTGNGYASEDKGFMDWNIPWNQYANA
jgi:lipoprotein-anchoring transpeptidase ErfK/SrfK